MLNCNHVSAVGQYCHLLNNTLVELPYCAGEPYSIHLPQSCVLSDILENLDLKLNSTSYSHLWPGSCAESLASRTEGFDYL